MNSFSKWSEVLVLKYILRVEIPFWSCINPEIWQNVYCLRQKHKLSTYQAMFRGNNMPLPSPNIYKSVCTTNPYSQMWNETMNIIERCQFKKQSLYPKLRRNTFTTRGTVTVLQVDNFRQFLRFYYTFNYKG